MLPLSSCIPLHLFPLDEGYFYKKVNMGLLILDLLPEPGPPFRNIGSYFAFAFKAPISRFMSQLLLE